jgi:pimeloyl-ACP methyl ester carboxylesterase
MPESSFIDVDGHATHLLAAGAGPPLVFLHGTAPAGEWLPVHALLARRFTVYAPDHPGFGKTARPEWLTGMDDLALHYDALFRALGLERPAVAGFSLGGWIAAELAVTYPERLGALVLLNSGGLHLEGHLIPDLFALGGKELARTVFHDPQAAAAFFGARRGPEERLHAFSAMTTLALLAWNPWYDPKLLRRLRRIQAPTLVLWAEHDRLIPSPYGEAFRAAIPGARLELLPDCGHMALVERPEAVAGAIAGFVEGVHRSGAASAEKAIGK